jgi:hypothetical protein
MPKFRKRPVVIEAEQWFPDKCVDGVVPFDRPTPDNPHGTYGQVETLEGWVTCVPGDWIITGVKGEKYPCKDEIFRLTYEAVEEEGEVR